MPFNPCLQCGACCAFFRVSFYWRETSDQTPNGVPLDMTEDVGSHYRAMAGTNKTLPRCIALKGIIGHDVSCSIYENRSSTCRLFTASFSDGQYHEDCARARAKYGLSELTTKDYEETPPLSPSTAPSIAG
ncbi:MAG: YkgJ family cysteine cluster protein [Candidatus Cloacimonetes bacterium]|nr:YkgJ family cysteine cluster protein [Candidatus Cloacimonadota bacterium]